jgi:small-conductance mechanosensitive channel
LLAAAGGLQADELTDLLTGKPEERQAPAEKVITTRASTQSDRDIRRRLQQIFSELNTLRSIEISVSSGVVRLTGEVDSADSEAKALQLARQVEGVVEVENELAVSRSLSKRLEYTGQKVAKIIKRLAAGVPLFALALLVFVLFWMFGRWTANRRSLFRRISPNHFIAGLLGQVTQLGFIVAGTVTALMLLDATALLGTILGAAGIFGLAVGFAVRDTVENYIASILLSLRNPFEVNDLVSINGKEGGVARLTSRATILISPDGNHIRIPNAEVFKAVIINFTRNPERRFDFDVGVDTAADLPAAQALALETLNATTGVLDEPKPMVVIEALGDSNVLLRIYAWVDQRYHSFIKVRSEAVRRVKAAFDEAGIVMPEPIYRLRVSEDGSGLPDARRKPVTAEVGDIQDVSAEPALRQRVMDAQTQGGGENLLRKDAPKEL